MCYLYLIQVSDSPVEVSLSSYCTPTQFLSVGWFPLLYKAVAGLGILLFWEAYQNWWGDDDMRYENKAELWPIALFLVLVF